MDCRKFSLPIGKIAAYSQVYRKVVKVSKQQIMLDLAKGVKGIETIVWVTVQDENGKELKGNLFVN